MDIMQKLKRMSERASKENFAFRFYKSGENLQDVDHDRNFKDLEWFKKGNDQLSQSGTAEIQATNIKGPQSDRSRKHSQQHSHLNQLHEQQSFQILNSLEQRANFKNHDLRTRSTKIVCTLGRNTKEVEPIKKMIKKGMDIARLNMNYFELFEQNEIICNVKKAAKDSGKNIAIMVDLKGPLIRTLGFKNMYSIKVESGKEIRLSSNQSILGDEGMFVIDYSNIHEHLRVGDKILVDYGGVVLTVVGFETEEKYMKRQKQELEKQASPFKEESKGLNEQGDSNSKLHPRKRKNSVGDEELFNKEIQELVNEESQDEDDLDFSQLQDRKDQNFPSLPQLDSSARLHIQAVQELKHERSQFDEVVKKGGQGFGAYQFTKRADNARKQQNNKRSLIKSNSNHNTGDFNFSSDLSQDTNIFQPSNRGNSGGSGLINYQMKRMSTDDRDFNPQQHLNSSQFKNLAPSKEYFAKKRMSRDEFLRDRQKFFKGQKKTGPKSRKSQSPATRMHQTSHQDHNTSCSVSESDNVSLIANPLGLEKTNSHQDLMDFNVPLFQKDKVLVICRVENDGQIKENKPIYIPKLDWQKDLKLSVLGPKDIKVLQNTIQQGVQIVAVSFVESREDLIYVKKVLGSKGQHIKLLAKIQSQKALLNFEQILEASDGIIIARGYLGLSLNLQDVVYVQKYLIKKCNLVGKPALLSTQIMESMVTRLIPSRSEVVDISNAVYDGIDSLILSPETAIGDFYEHATEKMSDICFEAESHINYIKRYQDQELLIKTELTSHYQDIFRKPILKWTPEEAISSCAVKASFDVRASLIIVFTHTGITARKIAKHKPKCPVLAVTPNEWAAKGVLLHRGVYSMLVGSLVGSDTLINKVLEEALERKFIDLGDYIIITSGLSGTVGSTNLLKIIKV